jgi:hypothetical protein
MMRVVYGDGSQVTPPFDLKLPPITTVTKGEGWLTVMFAEALGTTLYAMFYLNFSQNKLGGGDIVLSGLSLATVYYAMMWFT